MFHDGDNGQLELKQVEVNNIACGGAALATKVTSMHRKAMKQWEYVETTEGLVRIPPNQALTLVASGLSVAWKAYGMLKATFQFILGLKLFKPKYHFSNMFTINEKLFYVPICRAYFTLAFS